MTIMPVPAKYTQVGLTPTRGSNVDLEQLLPLAGVSYQHWWFETYSGAATLRDVKWAHSKRMGTWHISSMAEHQLVTLGVAGSVPVCAANEVKGARGRCFKTALCC